MAKWQYALVIALCFVALLSFLFAPRRHQLTVLDSTVEELLSNGEIRSGETRYEASYHYEDVAGQAQTLVVMLPANDPDFPDTPVEERVHEALRAAASGAGVTLPDSFMNHVIIKPYFPS